MKNLTASNGLEWESDGTAYLGAIPLEEHRREPMTVNEVLNALRNGMQWHDLTPDLPAHENTRGLAAVGGINEGLGVIVRFVYKSGTTHAVDSLYAIEARDFLPGPIASSVLAAVTAQPLPETICYTNMAPTVLAFHDEPEMVDPPGVERLNRQALEDHIARYIRAICAGEPDLPVPAGAVNRARFWLGLSAAAWQPANLRQIAAADLASAVRLDSLAMVWPQLRPKFTYRVGTADIRPATAITGSPWAEALCWSKRGIAPEAARFYAGFPVTEESFNMMSQTPEADERHADAVAAGLLREARERQVYLASGQFVLVLPKHLPWAQTAVAALAIHAQEAGLWVAGLTVRGERSATWWWDPGMTTQALDQHTMGAKPLVHLTLAAFWHDLVVTGDEVIVTPGREPRPFAERKNRRGVRGAGDPVVVLPRRIVHYSGRYEWSSAEDQEIIARRSHGVRGHLRVLQEGWSRSEQAESEAREWGFILPDGYTFVRPHIRGGHSPEPVIAKARGLQTLSALV
ncbi:MAG: hypothetical protein U0X20_22020 [Caldilineaceae bacterium]